MVNWSSWLWISVPAVLVAIVQMSWGIGWRMKLVPVCWRIAGRANVPVHWKEPLVVLRLIWIASASPMLQFHIKFGASRSRGQSVLGYG